MERVLHTKWGNAKIDNWGYYRITSRKEGNSRKFLHRLIWEDFWGTEVPQGYVIHHKNGNKLDNCILNLQLMRDKDHNCLHKSGENHHMFGKHHSDETKKQISYVQSEKNNTSGYYRVYQRKDKRCKQGFEWVYRYYDDNGKRKFINSVDIKKLEAKVKAKGLEWKKIGDG
jgi:hypothetical protein